MGFSRNALERLFAGHYHGHWRSTCWRSDAGPPEAHQCHRRTHRVGARGRSWPVLPEEEQLQPPLRGAHSPGRLARGRRARSPACLPSALRCAIREAAGQLTSGWDVAGLPLASPNRVPARRKGRGRSSEDPLCSATVPGHLLTPRGRPEGAPRSTTQWAPPGRAPPGRGAHSPPHSGAAWPPRRPRPCSGKAPFPLPPVHSPASGRSSRATRGRFAHVRAEHAPPPGPAAPAGALRPRPLCPQERRRRLPRRPIPRSPTAGAGSRNLGCAQPAPQPSPALPPSAPAAPGRC